MDKVKKFLEAYVQWLAMALGVGFLGWMIYSYVVMKPVSATVGSNSNVAPDEINKLIWEQVGEPLQTQVNSRNTPQQMGPKTDYVAEIIADLTKVPESVAMQTSTPFTPIPVPQDIDQDMQGGPSRNETKITKLPEAPALTDLVVSGGHSNVPAPVAAVVPGAPAPAANTVQAVDRNWRTIAGTIHTADLAKSFAAAGIAPGSTFSSTAILRVILVREERKSDGTWGSQTAIQPLDINPLPPLPAIHASFADQKSYLEDFAEKSFIPIARPPFYQVLQGDVWYEPGTKNPNESLDRVDDGYDPKNPGAYTGDINKLLPSEQKLVKLAKDRQAAIEARKSRIQNNRPQQTPGGFPPGFPGGGGAPPGFGPGGGGNPVADDPQRPMDGAPVYPRGFPGFPGPRGAFPGPQGAFPGPQAMPGEQPSAQTPLPSGSFDPSQQVDFKVWVHDPTVQAGKTYRYQMKYIISNPVGRTSNLCNPPELAKQFYIESKFSAWTTPVSVESDTNFYAVGLKHGIEFDVFKWKDGVWQMQDTTANVGDMVGGVNNNPASTVKTDFTTGWTLVDIREDPSNTDNRQLVLVSDNGTVLIKDLTSDADSPGLRRLYLLANDPKNKTAMAGTPAAGQN